MRDIYFITSLFLGIINMVNLYYCVNDQNLHIQIKLIRILGILIIQLNLITGNYIVRG